MHFSDPVLFELPVLPRVKKYIAVKLQDAAGNPQPMLVSAHCEGAGLMLYMLAQARKVCLWSGTHSRPGSHRGPRSGGLRILTPEDFTADIGVGICKFHPSRHQYLLNIAELNVFSNFVDYIILNEMVCYCEAAPDELPMKRIKQFTDRYDFSEDELSEHSLRQVYLRHRKGIGGHEFDVEISQQLHFQPITAMAA
ncbi:hypothetical protein DYU11_21110 [Fibrisoma montanum]|uniref:Uncharacterized protein n=1 Tax=Fibrisoma montanum TaxID=2305895 RepID=A0A418M408_9BACT|nr:hypothetical protein [Fibrisoma montanum]RIV20547.1 hypothetical protein DYU11_21110 [Fibrisoma montanum]